MQPCHRRGANAVEFVLCLPLVLIMVAGSLDFAMWALTRQAVSRAVQDGARQASVTVLDNGDGEPEMEFAAEQATLAALATWGIVDPGVSVDAEWDADNDGVWWLTVVARVPYASLFGSLEQAIDEPVTRQFVVYTQEQL